MEVKYFRLIKTIAVEGNIANSSEKLFLTQSALSHQLKELEDQLGFKVFLRKRNKWELTEEGEELHKLANNVLNSIEVGFNKIKTLQENSKGTIRMSMECYSFYQGISAFLQKMWMLYPEIKINLILEGTQHPISKLVAEEIDIAIVTVKPQIEGLTSTKIFEDETLTLVHEENELAEKAYLEPEDFASQHLIIHSFPMETVSVFEHFLKPNNILPRKITAIPLTEVSLDLVNSNQGIMCLPKWGLKSFNLPNEIVFKRMGRSGLIRQHYLVLRSSDISKKYITDFVTNFGESFAEKAGR
ncbi:MAG: LysR substrate-binding domain-containing protein [Cyclobacteriaceae bacterium]